MLIILTAGLRMITYHSISEFTHPQYPIVTVGTFDGVHVGHRQILSRICELAGEMGGEVVLLTFYPHPRKVLGKDAEGLEMLSSLREKQQLLEKFGVDHLIIHPFTLDFSRIEYDQFVRTILVEQLGVKKLVIGYDHQFGHDRKGGMLHLKELAPPLGFQVEEIPEQDIDAIAVSSTRIRNALKQGEVEVAEQLLGYSYPLTGTVVKGRQIGRTIGFPTANVLPEDPDKLIPANGIYAVYVDCAGSRWKGALSIGHRPTFDNGRRTIEVHLLGFDEDIYGQEITLHFKQFIRQEWKFESVEALVERMHKDIEMCAALL